jgi:hypothetical protein
VYVLDLRAARAHGGHRTRLRQQPMAQGTSCWALRAAARG